MARPAARLKACPDEELEFSHRLFSRAETKAHNQGVLTPEEAITSAAEAAALMARSWHA